jgi:hypothetical protein
VYISNIIQDAKARWINDEFAMNLSPNKVGNDNANDVLYLAVFLRLVSLLGRSTDELKSLANKAADVKRIDRGNFVRFTHAKSVTNSHDNYDGLAMLDESIADEIRLRGDEIGWDFNLTYDKELNFPTLRQPGTIAFTQLCAEKRPHLLNFALLIAGMIIGSFKFKSHVHHIAWVRSHKLRTIASKYAMDPAWRHIVWPLAVTFLIFDLASYVKFGNRHQAVVNYYAEEDHPNRRLALELIRKEAVK